MSTAPSPGPGTPVGAARRCRACGARLRQQESWCSLCHSSVLDDEPALSTPVEASAPAKPVEPGALVEPGEPVEPGAPVGPVERPADPAVAAAADRLLAQLAAAEAGRARESGLTALQGRLGVRGGGAMLAAIGGAILLVVGILGLTLLGLLL
jgi:hypothetical protein